MKKSTLKKLMALTLSMAMIFGMAACGSKEAPAEDAEAPAAEEPAETPAAEPAGDDFNPADYSVAICMDSMNHPSRSRPVHRIVQLGFLKAAEALGYENAKVIGTEGGDTSEAFAAAEAFAAEGGKGLLLWAGDSSSYNTIASVASQGVTVGIPHFRHTQEDGSYPEGLSFNMACDPVLYGKQVAELMAENLDGKEGSIALTQNTKNVTENAATDSFSETFKSLDGTYDLSKIKILDVQLEGAVVDQATAINLAIIQANPDLISRWTQRKVTWIIWSRARFRP